MEDEEEGLGEGVGDGGGEGDGGGGAAGGLEDDGGDGGGHQNSCQRHCCQVGQEEIFWECMEADPGQGGGEDLAGNSQCGGIPDVSYQAVSF